MTLKRVIILSILVLSFGSNVFAQEIGLGEWRTHYSYQQGQSIDRMGDKIYAVASGSLFSYGLNDNSIETYSKQDGLHDVDINLIRYSEGFQTLIICYSNGNIDLKTENQIWNIPDINLKVTTGSKTINNITFKGDYAYLSTDLGVIVLNLRRREIKESYFLASGGNLNPVYDVALFEGTIYAATEKGLFKASENDPNLLNFANWSYEIMAPEYNKPYRFVKSFNNKLLASRSDDIESSASTYYFNGTAWSLLLNGTGLKSMRVNGEYLCCTYQASLLTYDKNLSLVSNINTLMYPDESAHTMYALDGIRIDTLLYFVAHREYGLMSVTAELNAVALAPDGPVSNSTWDIDISEAGVRVVPGATNISWNSTGTRAAVSTFKNGNWEILDYKNLPELNTVRDFIDIVTDPLDSEHFFTASFGNGLFEFQGDELITNYNKDNSPLIDIFAGYKFTRLNGLIFDQDHNLWVNNAEVSTNLHVLKDEDTWSSLQYTEIDNVGDRMYALGEMIITKDNNKWMILPKRRGLFVFNENGTFDNKNDDDHVLMASLLDVDDGDIISSETYSIVEDLDGSIWVGTSNGIAIYFNPQQVFEEKDYFPASRIKLPRLDEDDGRADYLLDGELISALAVDGGNRKWIGTGSSGVFLVSEDGLQTIYHFTEDNSILPSNSIQKIAVHPVTGEVFMATTKGLVSFRADATTGADVFENVKVFPNPVREDFLGSVSISGLVDETIVKITDISGNLVYETTSNGGTASWDVKNFYGERVGTGVYMIFCSNQDGTSSTMTKVLVINN